MSNETATKTRTRITADWGDMNLMEKMLTQASFDESPGAGSSGKNLKIQGAYTVTGVMGRRLLNQAAADGRVVVVEKMGAELRTVDFNALMRTLIEAYADGKIELPAPTTDEGDEG